MTRYMVEYNFIGDKPMNIRKFDNIWAATDFIENSTTDGNLVEIEVVKHE